MTFRYLDAQLTRENDALLAAAQSLDTKATVLAGFAATAVPFQLQTSMGWLGGVAVVLYLTSLGTSLSALWPRRLSGLVPRELLRLSEAAPAVVIGKVAGTKVAVFERNHHRSRRKAVLWVTAVVQLLGATTLSIIEALTGRSAW